MANSVKNLNARTTTVEELRTLSDNEFAQIELTWLYEWVVTHGEEGLAFFNEWIMRIGK